MHYERAALLGWAYCGDVDKNQRRKWYPIMFSRAGLAFHNEYSQAKMGNLGANMLDQTSRSVMIGFDFDY